MNSPGDVRGDKIRALRMERGITPRDFAYHAGLERKSLYNIERGDKRVSVRTLVAIADQLRVPLDELVYRAGDKDVQSADVAA